MIALMISFGFFFPSTGYTVSQEYQLKAAFIYKFLNFIEWRSASAETKVICTLDDLSIDTTLDELIKVHDPNFSKTKARTIHAVDDLQFCNVIFIGRSQSKMVPEILNAVATSPILTVSDIDQFARSGGVIELTIEDGHVRFTINQSAAKEKGLQISSQLLALAKEVI